MTQISRLWDRIRKRSKDDIPTRCARAYFETVYGEYRLLPPSTEIERQIATGIEDCYRADPDGLTMADALLFERVVIRLLPEANLRRKVVSLRDRYQGLATAEEYQAYAASKLLDPHAQPGDVPGLRAEAEELLSRFQHAYSTAPFREGVRNTLSVRIVSRLAALLLLAAAYYLVVMVVSRLDPEHSLKSLKDIPFLGDIPSILVVVVAGAAGGYLSVQQRIQSAPAEGDAIRGALSLNNGWFSVYLSPVSGALFAVLLYLLFIGGFLKGTLFPEVSAGSETGMPSFENFLRGCGPVGGINYAKLIVWSFIAGFAERLVPDTLNRLTGAVQTKEFAPAGKPPG